MKLIAVTLGTVASATWGAHSPMLPSHDWVVLDYAPGSSFGVGVTCSETHVFTAGSADSSVELKNPETGVSVEGTDEGSDRDVFLTKATIDGVPEAVWMYPSATDTTGGSTSYPRDVHVNGDGSLVVMGGYFTDSLVFGDDTMVNEKGESAMKDGFVVVIDASDGTPVWSKHMTSSNQVYVYGTFFGPTSGDIYLSGSHQDEDDEDSFGFVERVAGATGDTMWRVSWGVGVNTLGEIMATEDESVVVAVGSFVGKKDFGGAVGELETTKEDVAEALVIGLDPSDGTALWATVIADFDHVEDGSSSSIGHMDLKSGFVYAACSGGCSSVRTSGSEDDVYELALGAHSGAVVKLAAATGKVEWGADCPGAFGIAASTAAQGGNVYVQAGGGDTTIGDVSFLGMGSQDQIILKINSAGEGEWALQSGGNDLEYLRRIAIDPHGDLYTSGRTDSDPVYFDPFVIDNHITEAEPMADMYVAKLLTTQEALPPCKSSATVVKAGYCFIGNACYDDGEPARGVVTCLACDASQSQTEFSGPTHDGCYIDGACVDDGAYHSYTAASWAGGGTTVSECAYCDPAKADRAWSVADGYIHDSTADVGEDCTEGEAAPAPAPAPAPARLCRRLPLPLW